MLLDGSFIESMLQSSLTLGSSIMESTFNKFDKFSTSKKKFSTEVNLRIISFQSFIDLTFIELEPNICVFVFGILNYLEDCWLNYQRQINSCLIWYYFSTYLSFWYRGSDGSIDCLKFIILKALFWALCIISNVLLWPWPQIRHAYLICESKSA